jgi:phenylpyruvate tautomerase PptA (4-oxalocrotonate tautomerase family)
MPYMKLTTPELSVEQREQIARQLTEAVVRLMAPPGGRGPTAQELRERCTVHFTPYEPTMMAIGGKLMRDRAEKDVTMEFSDWGLSLNHLRLLARELTPVLAKLFGMEGQLDHVNIRFHPYPPHHFAVGGKLLYDLIPIIGRIMKPLMGGRAAARASAVDT